MEHISKQINSQRYLQRARTPDALSIRRRDKPTRLWIDNEFFENGYAAIFPQNATPVYCVLARHANARKQICWPKTQTIMRLSGVKNQRTVIDAIRILEGHNIIAVKRTKGHKSNIYTLLDNSIWKPPDLNIVAMVQNKRKGKPTVAKNSLQPWQMAPPTVAPVPH